MKRNNNPQIAIVVPCYNEEEVLPTTIERLLALKDGLVQEGLIASTSTITFVDDGSRDTTWSLIENAVKASPSIHGIKLSKNFGHQNALIAGLLNVEGDAVVSIDADLQDDLSAIREMVVRYLDEAEVVYGVRKHRQSDTLFKRLTAEGYYKLLASFGVDIVFNHADYRLLGRSALNALKDFGETNLFLRGIIPQLGFKSASVYYKREERFAGESKYPIKKMFALAWDGLTSFSPMPLRVITAFGMVVSVFTFLMSIFVLIYKLFFDGSVPGWASTVMPIFFLGGVQLLSLGVIGEYIYKIYSEVKHRPRYIVERRIQG